MKKNISLLLAVLSPLVANAQNISSSKWADLFSYNNILTIREDQGTLIAATENGIFYYTPSSGEITKLSKANGLHEVKISAFDYNPETKTGLVGYANGTMDVIKEDGITFVVDIPLATGFSGSRNINHISITGSQAVISADYGVSIFNLDRKEFADTAFFLNSSGSYDVAKGAVIKDNTVYAITQSGIKKHEINVTFPIYSGWSTTATGTFNHIDIENDLIVIGGRSQVLYGNGDSFSTISQNFSNVQDVTISPQNILITDGNNVYAYSTTGQRTGNLDTEKALNTAWLSNGQIYAGSRTDGILDEKLISYKPDGPYNNRAYTLSLSDDKIWVSTGTRTNRYSGPPSVTEVPSLGFSYFNGNQWIYPSYFLNNNGRFNILDVTPNPKDNNEIFFSNQTNATNQGFYKMKYNPSTNDFELDTFYSTGAPYYLNRPVGITYDDKNNLFATTSVYTNNWLSTYSLFNSSNFNYKEIPGTNGDSGVQKPLFHEGLLLIPIPRKNILSIVDLNNTPTNLNDDVVYPVNSDNGLPSDSDGVISVAVDKTGDAWVGTNNGLRVINSISSNYQNALAEAVIIEQKGVGEELFRNSSVLQIEVDSGNQKWVSIERGGVFYLSQNGQNTIQHFTKENSPLPNNTVTDIKIDTKTGKVYFATFDGIVVYQGDVANVTENFGDVLVYPNPVVYANYKGNVRIKGLAERTHIRITDAAGNLVHQATARGGYYDWDLTNRGKRVASGIYFVLMTNDNGTDKATAKIAVVN